MHARFPQPLEIRRRARRGGEKDAFRLIYRYTKLGKCGRTIERENEKMVLAGIKVSRFEIEPIYGRGTDFNLTIVFEVWQGEDEVEQQEQQEQREREREQREQEEQEQGEQHEEWQGQSQWQEEQQEEWQSQWQEEQQVRRTRR